jgi:hypothetical protein
MATQLQTTREDLWSVVAGPRPGCGRSPAPLAFVGYISGLGGTGIDAPLSYKQSSVNIHITVNATVGAATTVTTAPTAIDAIALTARPNDAGRS